MKETKLSNYSINKVIRILIYGTWNFFVWSIQTRPPYEVDILYKQRSHRFYLNTNRSIYFPISSTNYIVIPYDFTVPHFGQLCVILRIRYPKMFDHWKDINTKSNILE